MGISITGGCSHTLISNHFIDHIMPQANGAYVKVYLYLLRNTMMPAALPDSELTVASIADHLGDTEGDILRAISWLESQGVLRTVRTADGSLSELRLIESSVPQTSVAKASAAEFSATSVDDTPVDDANSAQATPNIPAAKTRPEIPTYSRAQIQKLTENDEVKWIMSIAERYLERLLNPADIQLIIYLYESIGFPADLILYLYEYCASRGKKNPAYIEAVALSWAEQDIRSVEEAEAASSKYNAGYQAVAKAFGLNRMPGVAEQQFIDRWTGQYGFSLEIIEEACSRSLLSTQRPDFKYADKILENWHKKGITTRADIQKADQLHNQQSMSKTAQNTGTAGNTGNRSNNRFNAFPQRTYTGDDYSSMEQRLLKRQG